MPSLIRQKDPGNPVERSRDRRRANSAFVMNERRSGFDRRGPRTRWARLQERALVPLRHHDGNLLALLVTANILNVLDFLFTLRALAHGAVETNPFMRVLFSVDPVAAGAVKVAIVLAASLLVWRFRRYRLTLLAGLALPVVFGLVYVYQLYGVTLTGT
jgi:hypothetical protein